VPSLSVFRSIRNRVLVDVRQQHWLLPFSATVSGPYPVLDGGKSIWAVPDFEFIKAVG
jgi:hypothetical protein